MEEVEVIRGADIRTETVTTTRKVEEEEEEGRRRRRIRRRRRVIVGIGADLSYDAIRLCYTGTGMLTDTSIFESAERAGRPCAHRYAPPRCTFDSDLRICYEDSQEDMGEVRR